ncbi:MAG: DUF6702 family protein [Psychrobium sp.]
MKRFVVLLMMLVLGSSQALAHKFFVGSTEILVNEHTKSIEIIHRLTSHDLEFMLSDMHQQQIEADSAEYLKMVEDYVAKNFMLKDKDGKVLPLTLIGIEAGLNETFIYQEIEGVKNLKGVTVFHKLLTDYFVNQKNRVIYESPAQSLSLLFDNNTRVQTIK